jgi:hypothetical protein
MRLYPPFVNLLFGGGLQYMAILRVREGDVADDMPRHEARPRRIGSDGRRLW